MIYNKTCPYENNANYYKLVNLLKHLEEEALVLRKMQKV